MVHPSTPLAAFICRRHRFLLAVMTAVTIVLAAGLPRIEFETSQDALVGNDSTAARANADFQDAFGGEPMLILLSAKDGRTVEDLFTPASLADLRELDDALHDAGRFHSVLGPLSSMRIAEQMSTAGPQLLELASTRQQALAADISGSDGGSPADTEAAVAGVVAGFGDRLAGLAERAAPVITEGAALGLDDPFVMENPSFVRLSLRDDNGEIRSSQRDVFPDDTHALIVVRLPGNLELAATGDALAEVQATAAEHPVDGFAMTVTGSPALIEEINDYLEGGMTRLGLLAAVAMVVVLAFLFRVPDRLLPLLSVVVGTTWAFGLLGYVGIPLTMITISGLPILVGIGVDFAVQTQSRFAEEQLAGDGSEAALGRVIATVVPTLGVAVIAAAAGFLSLLFSEVELIRQFGLMLAIGVGCLYAAGIGITTSVLAWRHRGAVPPGPAEGTTAGFVERGVARLSDIGTAPLAVLVPIGLMVIIGGLIVEGRFSIETDPENWVPADSEAVAELSAVRDVTGTSSEVSLLIESPDVTDTAISEWTGAFAASELARRPDQLLRAAYIGTSVEAVTGFPPSQSELNLFLDGAPVDLVDSFIDEGHRRTALVFPIPPITLSERADLVDELIAELDPDGLDTAETGVLAPPPGTRVTPAGLAVVGVALVDALEANRGLITWSALMAVGLWLLVVYRRIELALLPLVPVLIAVGASSLVIALLGVELSPITSVTAPLVIATCTEFTVLIQARYLEERKRGRSPDEAVAQGALRIGRAFVVSGLTTAIGFGALALSSYPLLRDFGLVVSVDVLVALVASLTILPSLLVRADRRFGLVGRAANG